MTANDPQISLVDLALVGDAILRVLNPLNALQILARSADQEDHLVSASKAETAARCIGQLIAFLRTYESRCYETIPIVQLAVCAYPEDGIVSLAGQKGTTWTELAFELAQFFYGIAIDCEGVYFDSLEYNDNVEPIFDGEENHANLNKFIGDFEEFSAYSGDDADLAQHIDKPNREELSAIAAIANSVFSDSPAEDTEDAGPATHSGELEPFTARAWPATALRLRAIAWFDASDLNARVSKEIKRTQAWILGGGLKLLQVAAAEPTASASTPSNAVVTLLAPRGEVQIKTVGPTILADWDQVPAEFRVGGTLAGEPLTRREARLLGEEFGIHVESYYFSENRGLKKILSKWLVVKREHVHCLDEVMTLFQRRADWEDADSKSRLAKAPKFRTQKAE